MEALLVLRQAHPFTLMAGNDRIFARARKAGANGAVTGVGCAIPELMLALDGAIASCRSDVVDRLDARVQEFIGRIDEFPTPVGVKAAVGTRKVKIGPHSSPLGPELSSKLQRFEAWFREWLPGVLGECRAG
jgi:dihydrodipicolinate synthase/N-acetylneuraminate lyase